MLIYIHMDEFHAFAQSEGLVQFVSSVLEHASRLIG